MDAFEFEYKFVAYT